VRSDVMLKMWDLFRQNGIEIPYPQRDLTITNPEALARALSVRPVHREPAYQAGERRLGA
jgi:small-conductance mechanosensitive channel